MDAHAAGCDICGGCILFAAFSIAFDLVELPQEILGRSGRGGHGRPSLSTGYIDMHIATKRVYDPIGDDGVRILVDRLWPRGVSKDNLQGVWIKEAAPSTELRKWYDHQPEKWLEFKRRYFAELDERPEFVKKIVKLVQNGKVTFLYASKNNESNHALALIEYLKNVLNKQVSELSEE